MKVLVLGATGAVGSVIVRELITQGVDVTAASRRSATAAIDVSHAHGLTALTEHARRHDVVINASGVESVEILAASAPTAYVDISATARFLAALTAAAHPHQSVLLGAGLVPGLSTMLIDELPSRTGDEIDLAVLLGTGEQHGPAAVQWTAELAGSDLHDPPERMPVRNLTQWRTLPSLTRRRAHVRADFPDHLLIGQPRSLTVRSYLAVGDPVTTSALGIVGRFPKLAPIMSRTPHFGSAAWNLTAVNRRTGIQLSAHGSGQSRATGVLTAMAAIALVRDAPSRIVTSADLLSLSEVPPLA